MNPIISNRSKLEDGYLISKYKTEKAIFESQGVNVITEEYTLRTKIQPNKLGVLLVGIGGCNGTTFVAGVESHRNNVKWEERRGTREPNWKGSMLLSGTDIIGVDTNGDKVYKSLHQIIPMINPKEFVIGGWDIDGTKLGDAMRRSQVLDITLQQQLYKTMQTYDVMPGVYIRDYIAENQAPRANHTLSGNRKELLEQLKAQIRTFKSQAKVDVCIVLWTASTEKSIVLQDGIHDNEKNLLQAIERDDPAISPSILYAVAAISENCIFLNGSPQNTLIPGVIQLAENRNVCIGGNDFKTGQTRLKTLLSEFFTSLGIKMESIASYNHLGNNDGHNLEGEEQFLSKKTSKAGVIRESVQSNPILYPSKKEPDQTVVIKYIPYVGDTKRAIDEYCCSIFMEGDFVLSSYNLCEDSLLAVPIMYDMLILSELLSRVQIYKTTNEKMEIKLIVMELLSLFFKSPQSHGSSPTNGIKAQVEAISTFVKALAGIPCTNYWNLITHT